MSKWKNIVYVALIIQFGSGCMSSRTFTQEELRADQNHDIKIRTVDGRVILFDANHYSLTNEDSGTVMGKGEVLIDRWKDIYTEWDGKISFTEIESISEYNLSTTNTALLLVGLAAGGYLAVWIAIAASGRWH